VTLEPDNPSNPVITLLDHGLYQNLKSSFRRSYCGLWMSVLNRDVPGIKSHSKALNVGDLAELFACMVTGRSWASITAGIDRHGKTAAEEDEIKREAGKYLPQISAVSHTFVLLHLGHKKYRQPCLLCTPRNFYKVQNF
jgi:aarF domain-containing kinase